MDQVLVRLLKRKTSIENDLDVFLEVEFTHKDGSPDLSLSVYQLDTLPSLSLIRTCAEHTAGNNLNPQVRACLDVTNAPVESIKTTPTQNVLFDFTFSSAAHREIQFADKQSLRKFAEEVFEHLNESPSISHNVSTSAVKKYAYQKHQSNDSEWLEVCLKSTKVKQWVMKGKNQ